MSKVIIFGSSRSFGNTRKVLNEIIGQSAIDLVDLSDFAIAPFDYEHRNAHDDFLPLIEKLIAYDHWIIATPVYWYSMSTQHKIFFDRFSDLLDIRKDLGRKLCGKKLFVIASFQSSYPRGFEDTFAQICEYLNMNYTGCSFVYSGTENSEFLLKNEGFIAKARLELEIHS